MSSLELLEKIGSGGFGEVYVGRWKHQKVAVKKFLLGRDNNEMIQREIDLIRKLRNRYIIQFYDTVKLEPDGTIVMVTDYAEKGSLSKILRNHEETMTWNMRRRITNEILYGLAFLHENRIIHRDLKSGNILVTRKDEIKLCDFGLAQIKIKSASVSMDTRCVGTIRWMAPELLTLRPRYSPKSDMYALGMVMWEIASRNTIPFAEVADNAVIMECVKKGWREEIPKETPSDYTEMIKQCWKEKPEDRPEAHKMIEQTTIFANPPDSETIPESNESGKKTSFDLDVSAPTLSDTTNSPSAVSSSTGEGPLSQEDDRMVAATKALRELNRFRKDILKL